MGDSHDAHTALCCHLREADRQFCEFLLLACFAAHSDHVLDRLEHHELTTECFLEHPYLRHQFISALTVLEVVLVEVSTCRDPCD